MKIMIYNIKAIYKTKITCVDVILASFSLLLTSHTLTTPSWLATAKLSEFWFQEHENPASFEANELYIVFKS